MKVRALRLAVPCLLAGLASCASVKLEPEGPTSGHFRSWAVSLTLLGRDMPQAALLLARGNAADTQLPNLVIEKQHVFPYLWRLDFLLDIFSIRYASVSGTWGPADG